MLSKLINSCIRYRKSMLGATLILTLFFGYFATQIEINSDLISYLKPDDVEIQLFNRIGNDYGGNTLVLVAVQGADVFTPAALTTINDLTGALRQAPGVASVMSLTNILDIKQSPAGIEIGKLINPDDLPDSAEELATLKAYTLSKNLYAGRLISHDARTALIICRLQPNILKDEVAARIRQITEAKKGHLKTWYSGFPLQMLEMNHSLIDDLINLIPITICLVIAILYLSFRNKIGVIFPLAIVLIATIWTVGLMRLCQVQFSIISNVMPVLLIAMGAAYGIHFLARYQENGIGTGTIGQLVLKSANEVAIPIFLAGFTTLIGFLSFFGSYLTAINEFGLFSAFGIAIAMCLSLLLIPVALVHFRIPPPAIPARTESKGLARALEGLAHLVLKNKIVWISGGFCLLVISVFAIPKLDTEVNFIEYLPPKSAARQGHDLMQREFGGSLPIEIVVQADLKNPLVLKEILRLEKFLKTVPYVNHPQSIADLICEMNEVMNGHATIPPTAEQVANLLFLIEGEEVINQLVSPDYREGIIRAVTDNENTGVTLQTIQRIEGFIQTKMDTALVSVTLEKGPLAVQDSLWKRVSQQAAQAILYDLPSESAPPQISASTLVTRLEQLIRQRPTSLTPARQIHLKQRISRFLQTEAPLELPRALSTTTVVNEIVTFAAPQPLNADTVQDVLKKRIPAPVWQADLESLALTCETIAAQVNEELAQNYVDYLIQGVLGILPRPLQTDPQFLADLRADLWIFTETNFGMPAPRTHFNRSPMPISIHYHLSGMIKVLERVNANLLKSQIQSLFLALVLVWLLMSWQFHSWRMGLIVISPIVITVLFNFDLMAFLKTPLDNASMMVSSIAIGIGIDYAIHFSNRFKSEFSQQPKAAAAYLITMRTTGRAIIINAGTVALGFIVLMGSRLLPVQRFGWLIAVTMVVSALSALTFLPVLFLLFQKYFRVTSPK